MLVETLRKRYVYILIDSPPATAVTDAAVLSKGVGCVVVVRAGPYLNTGRKEWAGPI